MELPDIGPRAPSSPSCPPKPPCSHPGPHMGTHGPAFPPHDGRASAIALEAAKRAKDAQKAQKCAGAKAAKQVKEELAKRAMVAAMAAQNALDMKTAMVEKMRRDLDEAMCVVHEEEVAYEKAKAHVQMVMSDMETTVELMKILKKATCLTTTKLENTNEALECAEHNMNDKEGLVRAVMRRINAMRDELRAAEQELHCICEAAQRAGTAAKEAQQGAIRERRARQKRWKSSREKWTGGRLRGGQRRSFQGSERR